ncbi:hypothetical protein ILYODFUR_036793 [Ilyodon furcidens]|uniref:Uncharacterized protein n=1 Tax=Ilyodon furcidens TaxID=33524 RepID=A0ABV0STB3_9TELE
MSKNSRAVGRKVGNNSSGVVALMFMSSSLVRELRVPSQKTVLKHKTKQNNAHQHAEATICCAILQAFPQFYHGDGVFRLLLVFHHTSNMFLFSPLVYVDNNDLHLC